MCNERYSALITAWCALVQEGSIDDQDSKEIFSDLTNWVVHTGVEVDYETLMTWRGDIFKLMKNIDSCDEYEEDDVLDFVWSEQCCSAMTESNFRRIFNDAPMRIQNGFIETLENENEVLANQGAVHDANHEHQLDLAIHYAGETYGNYDDNYEPPESQQFQFPDGTQENPIVIESDDDMPALEGESDDDMPALEGESDLDETDGESECESNSDCASDSESDCGTDYDSDTVETFPCSRAVLV